MSAATPTATGTAAAGTASAGSPDGPRDRLNHCFSADGRYAACLALDPMSGELVVESWTFAGGGAEPVRLRAGAPETVHSQLVPVGPGRVLVARQCPEAHELALLSASAGVATVDGAARERRLAAPTDPEFRVLPLAGPAAPVVAASTGSDGRTTLCRVELATGGLVPLTTVDWPVRSGVWLDRAGRLLGTTRIVDGRARPVVLDLAAGTVHRLPVGDAHLLLASPSSGVLLLCRAEGPAQLVYAGRDGTVRHRAAALVAVDGAVLPLAFDPLGRRIALRVRRGAQHRLLVHDAVADRVRELTMPAGVVGAVGAWGASALRFPYGSPTCPSAIAELRTTGRGGWRLAGGAAARDWRTARLEIFPGAAGDIEAVVYGDWRAAAEVAVVLHGGPDSAWELDFQPLLQMLAGAGIAVVAPNPRGSSGYPPRFRDAIRGRWGGPDLADVVRLGEELVARRPSGADRPAVLGGSYGGFLALLAASTAPALWSRCAVTAPFLSTRRLYDQAAPAVRALVDRLGGCGPAGTDPDLLDLCPRIRVPLLLIHGERDAVVPVAQSRALRDRLRAAGRREGTDFGYLEVPDAGHVPLLPEASPARRPPTARDRAVARFLRTGDLTPFRCRPHRGNPPSTTERR